MLNNKNETQWILKDRHIIFEGAMKENLEVSSDYKRLLPGLLTGIFFSSDGKTIYTANLGNDLLKYDLK